jgi:hypothetical protein
LLNILSFNDSDCKQKLNESINLNNNFNNRNNDNKIVVNHFPLPNPKARDKYKMNITSLKSKLIF